MWGARIALYVLTMMAWVSDLMPTWSAMVCLSIAYIVTGGHYTFYLLWHTGMRDARGAYRYLRLLSLVYYYMKKDLTVPKVFASTAKTYGKKACLIFEDQTWSFDDLEAYSNRVAHVFLRAGFKHGDCVALFMENRLEYVGIWLGCTKLGLVPAFINNNLTGQPLVHSVRAASAKALIYGSELSKAIQEITPEIDPGLQMFVSGSKTSSVRGVTNLDPEIVNSISDPLPDSVQKLNHFNDKLLYIYTSGTTGLPKAAVIKNSRFYFYCAGMYYMGNLGAVKDPIFYNPLPLYHSAGGIVGIGLMMVFGCTVVIRKKFSVRHFWEDCHRHNCNGAQYIGEICRYLLSAPETPEEKLHKVEIMIGNGLRPPIWDQFVKRFGIKRIVEFYGATEGNSSVINIDSRQGSVGFTSVLLPFVYPVRLIRVNEQTGEVMRDPKTGLCVNCLPGQPGEFIGKIVRNHPSRSFDGYVDKAATEKKIVRDVLHKGDMWFRSGDLLFMDEFGWMYFVDRLGDTFRWRGENVSTNEVEAVISSLLQQQDTIVYGVEVPGVEGRAGMAAIVEPTDGLDLNSFVSAIQKQLPSYARPLFLRLVARLDITGTFKMKKIAMQKEGFNPNYIKDRLFFYDAVMGVYRQLDHCLYNDIIEMRCRI